MNAEMLRHLLPPDAAEQQFRRVDRIEKITQRTLGLVQDLLEVSRLAQNSFSVKPVPTQPGPLLAEAQAMLQPLADARTIELRFSGDDAPLVLADSPRVLQVLSNLVGNALRYTPEGGMIDVAWRADPDEFVVTVRDTGPGIPPERVPDLFGSLWQTDATDRCMPGLGLMIARTIVEAHDGRIWVATGEGPGATFRFTLPYAPTDQKQTGTPITATTET
jgi:signal transduction histidine kinase